MQRSPVAKPRTSIFSDHKKSARHEERAGDASTDLLTVSASPSPKHTYVNLMQTVQRDGSSRNATHNALPTPPRTEQHREVHSSNYQPPVTRNPVSRRLAHVYHEIPGPKPGGDHTLQSAPQPLRAIHHPHPPPLRPGKDSWR